MNFYNVITSQTPRLNKKWLSYEPKTICLYLGIRTKFVSYRPINWSNIKIFERDHMMGGLLLNFMHMHKYGHMVFG